MQDPLPVRPVSSARRRYILAGVLLLLVSLASVTAFVVFRLFGGDPRRPSPELIKLAESFRYHDSMLGVSGTFSLSPDGRLLAGNWDSSDRLSIWDVETGKPLRGAAEFTGTARHLWSPEASLLVIDDLPGVVTSSYSLLDIGSGSTRLTTLAPIPAGLPEKSSRGRAWTSIQGGHQFLGWADGGASFVTLTAAGLSDIDSSGDTDAKTSTHVFLQMWGVESGEMLHSTQFYSSELTPAPYGLVLSPDGGRLAFCWGDNIEFLSGSRTGVDVDLTLEIWDVRSGRLFNRVGGLRTVSAHYPGSTDRFLAWSPDGLFIYLTMGDRIEVIDTATGQQVRRFPPAVPSISTALPTATSQQAQPPGVIPPFPAVSTVPAPVGTMGPGSGIGPSIPPISIPDILRGLFPQPAPNGPVTPTPDPSRYDAPLGILLSPNGDTLAAYDDSVIRFWNTATGELQAITSVPFGHVQNVTSPMYGYSIHNASWAAGGSLFAVLDTATSGVTLIDPITGAHLRTLSSGTDYMQWSDDGRTVVLRKANGEGELEIWRIDTNGASVPQ